MSNDKCSWCGTSAIEAALRYEGPHATWCRHFRDEQRGGDDTLREAFNRAFLDGGRLVCNGETKAFQIGRREGWWSQGRGVNNADCVHIYAERHYQDYIEKA
jgi:hypothetical protein